jgi:ubiquinone/menaquinone biosynthesis C-methylase UbiE
LERRATTGSLEEGVIEDREIWNAAASTFDESADHGLRDTVVRESWRRLLSRLLPTTCRVLDVGCGTGSLSLLMAQAGHKVTGIDFAPAMIEQARAKALDAGVEIIFQAGDAAHPDFAASTFEVVLGRHILWAIPDIATSKVLERWVNLLEPGGRLALIEGFWHTGVGLRQREVLTAVPSTLEVLHTEDLSADTSLWGTRVSDERYVVLAKKPQA